jgi:hypothetical protein
MSLKAASAPFVDTTTKYSSQRGRAFSKIEAGWVSADVAFFASRGAKVTCHHVFPYPRPYDSLSEQLDAINAESQNRDEDYDRARPRTLCEEEFEIALSSGLQTSLDRKLYGEEAKQLSNIPAGVSPGVFTTILDGSYLDPIAVTAAEGQCFRVMSGEEDMSKWESRLQAWMIVFSRLTKRENMDELVRIYKRFVAYRQYRADDMEWRKANGIGENVHVSDIEGIPDEKRHGLFLRESQFVAYWRIAMEEAHVRRRMHLPSVSFKVQARPWDLEIPTKRYDRSRVLTGPYLAEAIELRKGENAQQSVGGSNVIHAM